ncbi:MAG: MarR family transcriptional regulator [Limnobacter sp.]|jgi:MarR family transcriptional regulator, organic hydroperoxide resistance regulator|uniref:MarR family winged helix-turn-helix transcriptional regulator n=1 Tax=unclassified Limnobacter TaxID=2630203 RepID=UPI000C6A8304|nr:MULTISPECIES: MarR family transcriptional regulator [unclassified Limnobacter]MAG81996.1 MarR family transcriptional regulator [Sutterellaceae bacterium]MBA4315951.1 MarR family transcriptional regulator [Alcaligenaceae bacterium]MBT82962.1 MarR family transcriptional regulator [Sutterellaceae bacterium]RZO91038.1 MAG: MarR family transcriptional regulator [Limnobacter sp.]HAV75445.1 MarR family transcriptional regulator [Limnobacter sp.]|tara:strand:- start:2150 stop:2587 length:438 start_codon:yes stop_codon:yes gene_type:complete
MKTENPLALDNQLCFSLYATSLAITQVYKPLLQPLGLTFPQYLVMMILWKEDGVSLINVARQLGQQPGALTPVIKRMAEQGLLTRNRSADDERQLQIYLTDEGKRIREQALDVYACVVEQCGMTPMDIHRLKCELDALRERLLKA